jgi:putative peptidoglycan lipid II flippase
MEHVRVPTLMTLVFIATHLGLGLLLKGPLLHEGLCIALSSAVTLQGVGLVVSLRSRIGALGLKKPCGALIRSFVATVPMSAAVYGISQLGIWSEGGNSIRNLGVVALSVVTGMVIYAATAHLFSMPEYIEFKKAFRTRRKR